MGIEEQKDKSFIRVYEPVAQTESGFLDFIQHCRINKRALADAAEFQTG
jgi:hypothetical protein